MEHRYEFAGIHLKVASDQDILYTEHGVLAPFCSLYKENEDALLEFSLTDELTPPQGSCIYRDGSKRIYQHDGGVVRYAGSEDRVHMRIQRQGSTRLVQCLRSEYPAGITPKTVLNAMEAEHLIVEKGGFILHASFICVGGKAILFTAPSGAGKSTQAELWCRCRSAEVINGDRVAVMIEQNGVYAHGIPFAGSSGVSYPARLPISAIVYLSQFKDNCLRQIAGIQAFRKIWEGISVNVWDRQDMERASDLVLKTVDRIPVFHFECRPDEDAVKLLHKSLTDRGYL